MFEQFHFLSPAWLWVLLVLPLLLWGLRRHQGAANPWLGVVDAKLLPYLLIKGGGERSRLPLILLGLGWVIGVLALANPTWERLPTPVYRSQQAVVVVLDLSQSMHTPDLAPSRLERARYKISDLLDHNADGQTALVAFAGDAFVVAPLSDDRTTVDSLLKVLEPRLMPVTGSRPDLAIATAQRLLTQAGAKHGTVLLVGDDAGGPRALDAANELVDHGHRLSVLGVGTTDGAPLPVRRGGLMRDSGGKIVVPQLDKAAMKALAEAGDGRYATITADGRDLRRLFPPQSLQLAGEVEDSGLTTDTWNAMGPWLALLLLPIGMLAFRRGWLVAMVLVLVSGVGGGLPSSAMAFEWNDLWQRSDQQAEAAVRQGDLKRAAEVAKDPLRRGAAQFMDGDYSAAAESFASGRDADAAYNRGNALAKLGKYEEAITAYDQALKTQPGMDDAVFNKEQVEALLKKQQEQQQKEGQDGKQSDQDQKDQQQADNQEGQAQQDSQDQQDQQGQQNQDQEGSQQADKQQAGEQDQQQQAGAESQPQDQAGESPQQQSDQQQEQQAAQDQAGEEGKEQEATAKADGETGDQSDEQDQPAPDHDQEQEARQANEAEPGEEQTDRQGKAAEAPLDSEEKMAMEQWLRRIPDDPGGLLRRKFLYQYRQRGAPAGAGSANPW
jgi:Ca-activated chloride channel family protein